MHGGRIFYTIEAGNTADGLFAINHSDGVIDLTRPINASELVEVRFLLTVRATDSGTPPQHSDTVVVVSVGTVDGNDPPVFQQDHFALNVVEHAPADSFVVQLNATDPDGPDEKLRYRIVGGSAVDWFNVDDVTGTVRVARGGKLEWDQETPFLSLLVAAVDQGQPLAQSATATLTIQVKTEITNYLRFLWLIHTCFVFHHIIKVEDVNDKPPMFSKQLFVHHVAEVTPVGAQVFTTQFLPHINGTAVFKSTKNVLFPLGSCLGRQ